MGLHIPFHIQRKLPCAFLFFHTSTLSTPSQFLCKNHFLHASSTVHNAAYKACAPLSLFFYSNILQDLVFLLPKTCVFYENNSERLYFIRHTNIILGKSCAARTFLSPLICICTPTL